jgi:hypothetical protein
MPLNHSAIKNWLLAVGKKYIDWFEATSVDSSFVGIIGG